MKSDTIQFFEGDDSVAPPERFRDRLISALRAKSREEIFLSGFVFIITLLLFGPVLQWMARQTLLHEQLKHAFIVLGLAGYAILMPSRYRVPVVLAFDSASLFQLTLAFSILGVSIWFSFAPGVLAGTCLALSAWILFAFGPKVQRATTVLLTVFAAYVFFMVSLTWFDWPLRAMAGSHAGWVLHHLGYETSLSLANPESPLLILTVNNRTFEVAAECNGFGMISSTVLLALLLVASRKRPLIDQVLGLVLAIFLGSMANTLRIVGICIGAPFFPDHYHLMHECIGFFFFWGVLALVWFILKPGKPAAVAKPVESPVTNRIS